MYHQLHGDSNNNKVRLKKCSNSKNVTRMTVNLLKHADFEISVCYIHPIHLIFRILIHITTRYNIISEETLNCIL